MNTATSLRIFAASAAACITTLLFSAVVSLANQPTHVGIVTLMSLANVPAAPVTALPMRRA